LAERLGVPIRAVELHRFPDGESLVRVAEPARDAVLYRSLDHPNDKLIEVVLAASALRDNGAEHLVLVAPYLPYMRQDVAFRPGEAVSQRVIGAWLAGHFDAIVAVEPHLHRTDDLAKVFPGCASVAVGAGPALADVLRTDGAGARTVVLGPDEESAPLAAATAEPLGLDWGVGEKIRSGDRDVAVTLPESLDLNGRPVVIVDDVVSSGMTLIDCASAALARGAGSVEALAVHALYPDDVSPLLDAAGIARIRSGDGVPHRSNAVSLHGVLAAALDDFMQ
ncbi:MAG: ribose-phosphate diphosphokinase, partial [Inquilinus sp.]|nr:ribose-phosphate diphosphokinase [Inquilinus sp.]